MKNCRKLSHISKWTQQHKHLRDTNIVPLDIFAPVNFSFIPLTFAVITPLCQLLFILLFLTFWQHHSLPPPPSHPSRLLAALSLTCELWPAAKALQANAAGAELRVTLLVFLRRMWQHVSQSLVGKKSGFYTVIVCWHCEQYKKVNLWPTRLFFSSSDMQTFSFPYWCDVLIAKKRSSSTNKQTYFHVQSFSAGKYEL